jgi:hypothetical protein
MQAYESPMKAARFVMTFISEIASFLKGRNWDMTERINITVMNILRFLSIMTPHLIIHETI